MKPINMDVMSVDDLLSMRMKIDEVLNKRVVHEQKELELRLARLKEIGGTVDRPTNSTRPRRKYPRVLPKYQNPAEPTQKWSGRGLQPRWLREAIKLGKTVSDFEIKRIAKPLPRTKKGGRRKPRS